MNGDRPMIGVVADDITGANDIGAMFATRGWEAQVWHADGFAFPPGERMPQALILDTDSRLDDGRTAYRKVFAATRALRDLGAERFFNKTCSVFRGNVGAELDGMLDALGQTFAVILLGFPKNGRRTVGGIHYVHGQRLEDSPFRRDPVHPMRQSDLVRILQAQTARRVGRIGFEWIDRGPTALRAELEAQREKGGYVILDCREQRDLAVIAQAGRHVRVWGGSSALAEELPAVLGNAGETPAEELPVPLRADRGVLVAAGSLTPQTKEQVAYLEERGVPAVEMDTLRLFDGAEREEERRRIAGILVPHLLRGRDAVLRSAHGESAVRETKAKGKAAGLDGRETARLVSGTLADIARRLLEESGQPALITAGGDTSAAVCRSLGVRGMRVWKEIQPGLPSCVSLSGPRRLLVLKSGSFGSADFLARALEHVKADGTPAGMKGGKP